MVDFDSVIKRMKDFNFNPNPNLVYIRIPDARKEIEEGIKYFTKDKATWLKGYDDIASWCENNEGRGLLVMGTCGLGKSLICGKILPILINEHYRKVVLITNGLDLNKNIDKISKYHFVYIDDIGIEDLANHFGEHRLTFAEIVDEAEKSGKLLIITTNLSPQEIENKYGIRTLDRLHAITKAVVLTGKSFRK